MLTNNIKLYIYYTTILVLSLLAFYLFDFITKQQSPDYLYTEKYILCIISSFFNVFVLFYHFTHAPHPKFLMINRRKYIVYIHITSGILEFIFCWLSFYTGNRYIGRFTSLIAIVAHVPSAYYQTSTVFGAKGFVVSAYLLSISLHLFCAIQLFMNPTSIHWLLNMFLIHNIYVWCRVFYFFFGFIGIFQDTIYTNSILVSGLILLPSVLSISGNLIFFGFVITSILLYYVIVQPNQSDRFAFLNEKTRNFLIDTSIHQQWIKDKARLLSLNEQQQLTEKQKAQEVFNLLDTNKNGFIDQSEMKELLKQWNADEAFMKRFGRWIKTDEISFEDFYKHIWRLSQTGEKFIKEHEIKENQEKARFIFDCLNSNNDEFLDATEIQKLLIQWGLPENEVDVYLQDDDDKQYTFDEFYQHMKPVWQFAYENMTVKAHSHSD